MLSLQIVGALGAAYGFLAYSMVRTQRRRGFRSVRIKGFGSHRDN